MSDDYTMMDVDSIVGKLKFLNDYCSLGLLSRVARRLHIQHGDDNKLKITNTGKILRSKNSSFIAVILDTGVLAGDFAVCDLIRQQIIWCTNVDWTQEARAMPHRAVIDLSGGLEIWNGNDQSVWKSKGLVNCHGIPHINLSDTGDLVLVSNRNNAEHHAWRSSGRRSSNGMVRSTATFPYVGQGMPHFCPLTFGRPGCVDDFRRDCFLSHRGPDCKESFVKALAAMLERMNITYFLDANQQAGPVAGNVAAAAHGCTLMVAIITRNFHRSEWCLAEANTGSSRDCLLLAFLDPEYASDPLYKSLNKEVYLQKKSQQLELNFCVQLAKNLHGRLRKDDPMPLSDDELKQIGEHAVTHG